MCEMPSSANIIKYVEIFEKNYKELKFIFSINFSIVLIFYRALSVLLLLNIASTDNYYPY